MNNSKIKILQQESYWTEMLETAKFNDWSNKQIAEEIAKGIKKAIEITSKEQYKTGFNKAIKDVEIYGATKVTEYGQK